MLARSVNHFGSEIIVHKRQVSFLVALGLLLASSVANAGSVSTVITGGTTATTTISLPKPGGGTFDAVFEMQFTNPQNLTAACLGISVDVLDSLAIAGIQARLPDPINQTVDPNFPIRITVEPPVGCGLAFEDEYQVSLITSNLVYQNFSRYRLMKAPIGAGFRDITLSVTAGSVRTRGCGGSLSEFLVVLDPLQNYVLQSQFSFSELNALLANPALGPTAQQTLQADADLSRASFDANDYTAAIARIDDLLAHATVLRGAVLPNDWRSQRDLLNLKGEIASVGYHLRFLLSRLNGVP